MPMTIAFETRLAVNKTNLSDTYIIVEARGKSGKSALIVLCIRLLSFIRRLPHLPDVDIRVFKLNYFYESTLVMAKLRPELRKFLTNIRLNATSILHSKYYVTCA